MIAERQAVRPDDRQVFEPPAGAFEQLNDRQRRFVKGLAEGRTIAEAHRRAGYRSRRPWDDGWKLKQQPKVAAALEEVRQQTGLTGRASKARIGFLGCSEGPPKGLGGQEVARPMTRRQEAFIRAYTGETRGHADRAAILAGYSAKHARQSGHQAKNTKQVKAALDAHRAAEYAELKAMVAARKAQKYGQFGAAMDAQLT